MTFLNQLQNLPEATQQLFFETGSEKSYAAGAWLPGADAGFKGIRLIQEGKVNVFASVDGDHIPVYCYGPGEALGIRSFLRPENIPPVKWQAASDCVVYELDAKDARVLLSDHPDAGPIREIFELSAHLRDLDILLAVHPLFQTLPEEARRELFLDAEPIALTPKQMLIEKGKSNESLFFICHGGVDIVKDGKIIAHRQAGEIIGEVSSLGFAPTADVRSSGWTHVLAFSRESILAACEKNKAFSAKLSSFGFGIF
ncbi:MAG TPA: cyclic nucleotide-binding domain-containing protein [Mariprofundaceae bacterium]|nr:cyclic nucleotide-binding domain-containing protein [Mariprofundaceae bacterium]